ncbi:MAG: DegT/DnrJ/EryC1/StrS family aminotransferase, partial [Candidatus Aureabacteria bacterium]|nr:DegT/DnrJ/EryC1/StrS family aminotransferase [Candidatus Auribacterota bacterium]
LHLNVPAKEHDHDFSKLSPGEQEDLRRWLKDIGHVRLGYSFDEIQRLFPRYEIMKMRKAGNCCYKIAFFFWEKVIFDPSRKPAEIKKEYTLPFASYLDLLINKYLVKAAHPAAPQEPLVNERMFLQAIRTIDLGIDLEEKGLLDRRYLIEEEICCLLRKVPPRRGEMLPFSRPSIGEEEISEVVHSMKSGWITTGPKCCQFEEDMKRYVGAEHAIALTSATAGLHLALLAAGIGAGDEVVTTSMTFAATANVIVLVGATPVFVDIGDDLNINPALIEAAITPKTKAIMPVHFAGYPCAMDAIMAIARRRRLIVIEDAAHAIGTEYGGKRIGSIGDMTVFSFHPIKNITTGEGGMLVTDSAPLAEKVRLLKFHGIQKDAWRRYGAKEIPQYEILFPGFKYNLTDLQAALGIHQMKKLDGFIEQRTRYAAIYNRIFAKVPEIMLPAAPATKGTRHAWHLYVVLVDTDRLALDRDRFMREMLDANIGIGLHFPAVHLQPYYMKTFGCRRGTLPKTEFVSDRIFSLPLYPGMSEHDMHDAAGAVVDIVARHRK